MIRINRPSDPPEKQRKRKNAKKEFRYNEDHIVAELWRMQRGKCCYCEKYLPERGHLKAVEHFRPKSVFKSLTNDWDNLLLACAQCNGEKSDQFPMQLTNKRKEPKVIYTTIDSKERSLLKGNGRTLLIDPSKENPEKYLDFIVDPMDIFGLIKAKNNKRRGKKTIEVINLADDFYNKGRRDFFIDSLLPRYLQMVRAKDRGNSSVLQTCKLDFDQWMEDSNELAGFARAFARSYGLDRDEYGISIPGDN